MIRHLPPQRCKIGVFVIYLHTSYSAKIVQLGIRKLADSGQVKIIDKTKLSNKALIVHA